MIRQTSFYLNKLYKIHWPFLIFLLSLINIKLYLKCVAIIFYFSYLLYKKWDLRGKLPSVSIFYFIMPVLGIIVPIINYAQIYHTYWMAYGLGALQWFISGLSFYLLYKTIKLIDKKSIVNTVDALFAINIVVTLGQLIRIMILSHNLMPYWIWDPAERFGASTGDNLYGILGGNSITNAAVCVLGIAYYISAGRIMPALMCLLIMLLCTSNISLFITVLILLLILIFYKARKQRFITLACLGFIALIYPVLSPVNLQYIQTIYKSMRVKTSPIVSEVKPATNTGSNLQNNVKYEINPYRLNINEAATEKNIQLLKYLKLNNDTNRGNNTNLTLNPELIKITFRNLYGIAPELASPETFKKPGKLFSIKQTLFKTTIAIRNSTCTQYTNF